MSAVVDLVIRTTPALANKLLKRGAADIITRMADGKFDAITKCAIQVLSSNHELNQNDFLRYLTTVKYGINPGVALGIDLLKTAGTIASSIKLNAISKDVKTILSKVGEIGLTLNTIKNVSYLNVGIGLVNLGTEIAGIIYIGKRLNDVQNSIGQLSNQICQVRNILTSDKVSYFQRLCLRFGAISVRIKDEDDIDRKEIETLLIDMRAFMSEMVRNVYYNAMDVEIILEMMFNLLSAYTALLNVYVREYYFEKKRLPDNLATYSNQLYNELMDEKFLKIIGDTLILQKHLDVRNMVAALQTQQLLVMNSMLQYQDNTDIIQMLETKDDYHSLMGIMDKYTEMEMERLIPIIEKQTGARDCRETIHRMIYEKAIAV